jgi:hypothetical protein
LRSPDGRREILAYTAQNIDALGGLSAPKMFFIFDEAGGIRLEFFEAMKGNAAGGVTWVMAGNPLHTTGEQFDAHHSKKHLYTHVQEISSAQTPNVIEGRKVIPGLATREWLERCAEDWGVDSSAYLIRCLGQFPRYEPGQLLRLEDVAASMTRWYSRVGRGRLQLGVDVAFTGDEAVIAPRRGERISELRAIRNTSPDALAAEVVNLAEELQEPHEQIPIVVYDAQGKTGAEFGRALAQYAGRVEIQPCYGNAKPRDIRKYYMRRDELAHAFATWIKVQNGCVPPDAKLEGEILRTIAKRVSPTDSRVKVPSNDEIRKILGRSPDRRNACELVCAWAHNEVKPAEGAAAVAPKPVRPPQAANDGVEDRHASTPRSWYGGADAGMARAWGEQR